MSEEDLQLLITLDDPWNAQECDSFNNHKAEPAVPHWPDPPNPRGRHDLRADNIIHNDFYKVTSNTSS